VGARLVLISLGGNDVLYFADEKLSSGDLAGLYTDFLPFLEGDRVLLVDVYTAWAAVPHLDDYLIDDSSIA